MKSSLIAVIVVLALAQGTLAAESPELQKMTDFFESMRTELMATVNKVSEAIQSQTLVQGGQAQMDPLVAQIKESFAPLATAIQEKVTPLTDQLQQRIQPFVTEFQQELESSVSKMMEKVQKLTVE
ncbi:Type-4 ice-structuring protein [Merluccius polli]|uniref:Type-4 ice-structuring protein n=1 Tax=Merluccius polli TaxID=89951 RepID=A0AA47MUL5_MERPO|nr:Type-4 ice-structuring protein [Merluccius polli]